MLPWQFNENIAESVKRFIILKNNANRIFIFVKMTLITTFEVLKYFCQLHCQILFKINSYFINRLVNFHGGERS